MEIKELKIRPSVDQNKKLHKAYAQFNKLLRELKTKELTDEVIISINKGIEEINAFPDSEKELSKHIRKAQASILKLIEKELKLVIKNHYRNTWMVLGIAAFGLPLGVAFGASLGNMGLLAIGLPIGMAIGLAVGTAMDKKANDEGRQLDFELSY
jgi:hypothetical protein